jgi:hypothetical protein
VGRARTVSRLTVAGATLLLGGASVIVGGLMESGQGPAFADSSPVELFCPGTPVGNLVANNAVISGSLSVGAPSSGQQFSLDGFQAQIPLSSDVVNDAQAIGNTSLSGTTQSTIEVSGATPASMPTGPMTFDAPIPNPVPSSGVTISVPTSAQAFGPFTASSQNITVALSQEISLVFDDAGNNIDLTCSWYPNDSIPQSGLTQQTPPGLPITPVVAFAGSGGGAPPAVSATGPYELYCPKTPVGNIALNDVVTSGTVEPTSLSAGDQFNLSGYQTQIPIPAGIASGLAGFGNTQLQGYSATTIDAFGASPSELSTGLEAFDVSLPNPIPPTGVTLDVPSTAGTVGPFTANGGAITVAGEQTTLMVAALSSHIVNLGCQAYPNDSVTPSGVVESAPLGSPILPVITTASASGTSPTTTTTTVPYNPSNPTPITGPYELFCPDTPLGNLVLNDTVTTASISPSDPSVGGAFDITGYQTQITVPQPILQLFAGVGVNTVSGMMEADVTASGALPENGGVIGVVSTPPSPVVTVPPYSVATGSSASPCHPAWRCRPARAGSAATDHPAVPRPRNGDVLGEHPHPDPVSGGDLRRPLAPRRPGDGLHRPRRPDRGRTTGAVPRAPGSRHGRLSSLLPGVSQRHRTRRGHDHAAATAGVPGADRQWERHALPAEPAVLHRCARGVLLGDDRQRGDERCHHRRFAVPL